MGVSVAPGNDYTLAKLADGVNEAFIQKDEAKEEEGGGAVVYRETAVASACGAESAVAGKWCRSNCCCRIRC